MGVELFRRIVARYNRADPFKADVALTALFIVAMVVESALLDPHGHSRTATVIAGCVALVPVAWRRRNPLFAAGAFGLLLALQLTVDTFIFDTATSPFIAWLLVVYSIGRYAEGRRGWLAAGLLNAGLVIGLAGSGSWEGPADVFWIVILFTPPFLAGRGIRSRVLLRHELREKAERLEAERERDAQRAVEDERNRIAAELQAVVANSVSAMVVQAEAIPRVLAAGDTARASDSFEVIEATGRDALAEMRRLLGVLRREGERPELAPQPGLARLDSLLERFRADGLHVDLTVEGEQRPLAPGVDLTAYRVLQEALDAAAQAGAEGAAITLRYNSRDLELQVRDDRGDDDDGNSLVAALRERVSLYGGHVRGGRAEDGGYALTARLPAERLAEATASIGGRS
jgi:signal transduction histidine kinase